MRLSCRPPLDAEGLIAFLAQRAVDGVEEVEDGVYRRSLRLPAGAGVVELRPSEECVQARFWLADRRDLSEAVRRSRELLDLDCEPQQVLGVLGADPLLGPLVREAPGRRVAGQVDPAELAARAVLGQQVSVRAACALAARLVGTCGEPLTRPVGGVTHLFPSAHALARADPEGLAMPRARALALQTLARALTRGELELDARADPSRARRRLLSLPGIGPWTTEYIAMRALRDADAFPASDLGVRRALQRLGHRGDPDSARELAERWRPYCAYAVVHLWASLQQCQQARTAPR